MRLYRWVISPAKALLFGPLGRCRFTPSCSEYALGAIQSHGALQGGGLAVRRICRCHPWGGCGEDPVPGRKSEIRNPESDAPGHRQSVLHNFLHSLRLSGIQAQRSSCRH
ncbi:MAG: membrane protein insertion efficiency factor YidD [Verrucomicrobiota bacterium]